MINPNIKYKFYLISHVDNKPYLIFTIKFNKDNVYFINSTPIENFRTKISYHTPRLPSNKSQVHFKINDKRVTDADLCCPVHKIRGTQYFGGNGVQLDQLLKLPIFKKHKKDEKCFIFDTSKLRRSRLSAIQWSWFLVEPKKVESFYEHNVIANGANCDFTERIHIQFIEETTPWIAVEFIRIKDENPVWYK